ncbi:flavodoxin family protein [Flaviflexus massiliensis]|uniref:flavodoxin family protein n=1 Tax=Flaviflexus massiliensis TaxID=1522309 RepID=UPI00097D0F01|nr:hypothetical protein [Flaviflexus massiliensis]
MRVLLVHESWFGNGRAVVEQVAHGISQVMDAAEVEVVTADKAPRVLPHGLQALVISSPTHELSMPTPKTRQVAIDQGASGSVDFGLAEWIRAVEPVAGLPVFAIDTCTKISSLIGSASKAAVREMKKRGFTEVHRSPSFLVGGTEGPLGKDQLKKAESWGRELGQDLDLLVED